MVQNNNIEVLKTCIDALLKYAKTPQELNIILSKLFLEAAANATASSMELLVKDADNGRLSQYFSIENNRGLTAFFSLSKKPELCQRYMAMARELFAVQSSQYSHILQDVLKGSIEHRQYAFFDELVTLAAEQELAASPAHIGQILNLAITTVANPLLKKKNIHLLPYLFQLLGLCREKNPQLYVDRLKNAVLSREHYNDGDPLLATILEAVKQADDIKPGAYASMVVKPFKDAVLNERQKSVALFLQDVSSDSLVALLTEANLLNHKHGFSDPMHTLLDQAFLDAAGRLKDHHSEQCGALARPQLLRAIQQGSSGAVRSLLPLVDKLRFAEDLQQELSNSFYYSNENWSIVAKDPELVCVIYQFLQPLQISQPSLYYNFVEKLLNKSIDKNSSSLLVSILANTPHDVLTKILLSKKPYQDRKLTDLLRLNDTAITQALVKVSEHIKKTKPADYALIEQELFIFSAQTGNLVLFNSLIETASTEELICKLTLKLDYNSTTIIDEAGKEKQVAILNRVFELAKKFQDSPRYVYLAVAHKLIINAALCGDFELINLIVDSCSKQELVQLFSVPRFSFDSCLKNIIKDHQIEAIAFILKAITPLAKIQPADYLNILRQMLHEAAEFSNLTLVSSILDAAGEENWLALFKVDRSITYSDGHDSIFSRAILNKDALVLKKIFDCVSLLKDKQPKQLEEQKRDLYSMGYLFQSAQDLKKFTVSDLALFIAKHSSPELINMCEGWNNIRGCETLISALRFNQNYEVQEFLFNWLRIHEKNNQARHLKILALGFKVAYLSDGYNKSQAVGAKYFLERILQEVGIDRLKNFLNTAVNERRLLKDFIFNGDVTILPSEMVQGLNKPSDSETDRILTPVHKEFSAALSQPSSTLVNMLKLASDEHLVEYFSSDKLSGPYKTKIWNSVFSNSDGEVFEAIFSACQRLKSVNEALFVSSISQAFADACEVAPLVTVQRIYAELPLKKQIIALGQETANHHQILVAGLENKNKGIFAYLISLLEPVKKSQPNRYIQIIRKNLEDCTSESDVLSSILNIIPASLLTQALLSNQDDSGSIFHHYNICQEGFELILNHLETQLNNPQYYRDYIKSLAFACHATLNNPEMNVLNTRILTHVPKSELLSLLTTYCRYGLIIDSIIDNESLWALNHIITALPSLRLIQPTEYLDFMAKLLPGLLNKKGLYEIAQKLFEALTEAELLKVLNFNGRHGQNLIEASLWGDDSGLVCKLLSVQVRRIRSFDRESYQQLNLSMLLSLIAISNNVSKESSVLALLEYLGAEEFSQLLAVSYRGQNAFSLLIPTKLFIGEDYGSIPTNIAYIILQAAKPLKYSSPIAYQNAIMDALILSAAKGSEKYIRLFLTLLPEQQWADFCLLENKAGINLITAAISSGDRTVVELVFGLFSVTDLKRVLAYRDSSGRNLILLAAAYGFFELIPWLRSQGLDILATDLFKQSIFDYAVDLGNLAAISVFRGFSLTASLIDKAGYKGRTPLMTAIKVGRLKAAAVLIQLGADLKLTDQQNYSALTWAVSSRQLTVIHNLIQAGAKVDSKSLEVARLIDDPDILAALKTVVSYARAQQSLNQLQPSSLQSSLPYDAKLSRNYLTLFPATKLKNKTYLSTAQLQTQSEAFFSLPDHDLTAMKTKYKDLSRYLPISDVLRREQVAQCVDNPKNLKITLYTGFTQEILLLRLVMQAMYKLEADQPGDIGIIQRNVLNEYWPSRAPDIDKYNHQHQSEFASSPRSDLSLWDWYNASLFGNATNPGDCSINYFLRDFNAQLLDLKALLESMFKALGLSSELSKVKDFINTLLDYAEKLKTPVGGLQVVELPISVVDQACRLEPKHGIKSIKVSEYILQSRKKPDSFPEFPQVEIVMMPGFLFNPKNGIQSRVYHAMARLHPKTFYEFQAWMKKGLKELLIHQPSAEVDSKNSETTRALPRLKAGL